MPGGGYHRRVREPASRVRRGADYRPDGLRAAEAAAVWTVRGNETSLRSSGTQSERRHLHDIDGMFFFFHGVPSVVDLEGDSGDN